LEQLVNIDGSTSMFECPLCHGVAWQPKVTMCCQKVFCGMCLDHWLLSSMACPQCHVPVVDRDGSTGGCSEQRVKKLDRTSSGVQAVLWRVYGNLRITCTHNCGWNGNLLTYSEHLASCPMEARGGQEDVSRDLSDDVRGTYAVVWEHKATDDSQLSLKVGDRVQVQQQAAHGWVYGRCLTPLPGNRSTEGWFPSFCLPEKRPPKPQASPPPMSPPDCTTQVVRDYMASDPAQLSVTKGELVKVRQRDQSGWTFVVRVGNPGSGKREGWVPDWLLQHEG